MESPIFTSQKKIQYIQKVFQCQSRKIFLNFFPFRNGVEVLNCSCGKFNLIIETTQNKFSGTFLVTLLI